MQKTSIQKKWWHGKIAYQIYPKSFKDSNGDGIGDIQGIISKLPYLHDLGVEIVWISPMYVSPLVDQGYDIADYEHIDPVFGTDADFDELVKKAKELGISIIMDLVVNHCSSEHIWFKKAIADKNSPYRDYFYFRQGKTDGTPPDNLRSYFGGSVWEKVPNEDNIYYLHYFAKEQPDLNWYNPKVREEIYAMMNRWFDRGVDGFRMDVINLIAKAEGLPDGAGKPSPEGYVFAPEHFADQPAAHDYIREMRETCFAGRDCMCVGETPFSSSATGFSYVDPNKGELDMVFSFDLMDIDSGKSGKWEIVPWNLARMKAIVEDWEVGQLRRQAENGLTFAALSPEAAATAFALALAHTLEPKRPIIWARQDFLDIETGRPYGPGCAELGLDPGRITLVRAHDGLDVLQAALEAARCSGLGAVVAELWGETKAFDLTASRRLALAAEASALPVLVVRCGATEEKVGTRR